MAGFARGSAVFAAKRLPVVIHFPWIDAQTLANPSCADPAAAVPGRRVAARTAAGANGAASAPREGAGKIAEHDPIATWVHVRTSSTRLIAFLQPFVAYEHCSLMLGDRI
jgi:hypothetical protein